MSGIAIWTQALKNIQDPDIIRSVEMVDVYLAVQARRCFTYSARLDLSIVSSTCWADINGILGRWEMLRLPGRWTPFWRYRIPLPIHTIKIRSAVFQLVLWVCTDYGHSKAPYEGNGCWGVLSWMASIVRVSALFGDSVEIITGVSA